VLTATALAYHARDYIEHNTMQPKTYQLGDKAKKWYTDNDEDDNESGHPNQDFDPFEGI
jgi:hypothetical protein